MRLDGLLGDLSDPDLGIDDLENEVQPVIIIMSKRCFIGFGSRKCGWGH